MIQMKIILLMTSCWNDLKKIWYLFHSNILWNNSSHPFVLLLFVGIKSCCHFYTHTMYSATGSRFAQPEQRTTAHLVNISNGYHLCTRALSNFKNYISKVRRIMICFWNLSSHILNRTNVTRLQLQIFWVY